MSNPEFSTIRMLDEQLEKAWNQIDFQQDAYRELLDKIDLKESLLLAQKEVIDRLRAERDALTDEVNDLRSALKVIATWASFDLKHGYEARALDAEHTLVIARRALGSAAIDAAREEK